MAPITNLTEPGATSGPPWPLVTSLGPLSDVRTRVRKKFSCPAGLPRAPRSSSHRTNGRIHDLQPQSEEGRWGSFSIISDKFVPFPAPHQSSPEEGHQKQTLYQDISSKFVSTPHTCGWGGLNTIHSTDVVRKTFEFWKMHCHSPISRAIDFFIARVLKLLHVN